MSEKFKVNVEHDDDLENETYIINPNPKPGQPAYIPKTTSD